jgi:hypothetical protein
MADNPERPESRPGLDPDTGHAVPSGVGPPKRPEGEDHDEVERGSDLSFPASDPPSTSDPGAHDQPRRR